jgi:septum formation protein
VSALVLASGSPRRRELLARLGVRFTVVPADVDETPRAGEDPLAYVQRLAAEKAASVPDRGEVVLAADTTVVLEGTILGKPTDAGEATAMLRALSGRAHLVHTGVTVRRGRRSAAASATTLVRFADLTPDDIAWYVATGEPPASSARGCTTWRCSAPTSSGPSASTRACSSSPDRAVREPRLPGLHALLLRHRQRQLPGVLRLARPRPRPVRRGARRAHHLAISVEPERWAAPAKSGSTSRRRVRPLEDRIVVRPASPRRPPPAAWSSPTPPRRSPSRARSSPSAPAALRADRRDHPRRRQGRRHRRLQQVRRHRDHRRR